MLKNDGHGGSARPSGNVEHARLVDLGDLSARKAPVGWRWRNILENRRRSAGQVTAARILGAAFGVCTQISELRGVLYHADYARLPLEKVLQLKRLLAENVDVRTLPAHFFGDATDYGILSRRLVTNAGVGYIVDAFQNLVELENMKFHGYGTGTTAEAQGDTALVTELTTEYATDSTRPTGSQTETSANIYRTVGTLSPDSGGTLAITEHGIFSAASAGTLLDRSKFAAVNLVAGADSLQTTYDLTVTAGG